MGPAARGRSPRGGGERGFPVAVVGAGPAGATLARLLATSGLPVLLVDEREPHEKVCGGGVTLRAYQGRQVLEAGKHGFTEVRLASVAAGGAEVEVELPGPVRIYPRRALNRVLFDAALAAGARFVEARLVGLERASGGFRLRLRGGTCLEARFVAGADGAAGTTRKILGGGRGRARFVLAVGHHAERSPGIARLSLAFRPGLPGYLWVFPRPDHFSVGICSRDPGASPRALRRVLLEELSALGWTPRPLPGTEYAFPVPDFDGFEGPRAGAGWALIGDAGGFVDPLTLEGISYALRSAEVLAQAILRGEPEGFEAAWRADFGHELERAAAVVGRFYAGDFPSRMVAAAAGSPRVRSILGGLLAGEVPYRGLRRRVARALLTDRARRLAARAWRLLPGAR